MAVHLWANLHWSHLQLSNSCPVSLQYWHHKVVSREPSLLIDGLEGLGVRTNLLPPLP